MFHVEIEECCIKYVWMLNSKDWIERNVLDFNINFSFLNLENVLVIAFALHIGVMSDGIGIVFA
jgi:hypothetical protein